MKQDKQMKQFDSILNDCLERLDKGETLEQCLQSYPGHEAGLKPLLLTALAVSKASSRIQPSAEFRTRARYQFRAALQEKMAKKRGWSLGWQPRWVTAVAVVLILILLGGGTVAAAGNSMPDQPLYPVKLATEQVRATLTPSPIAKAQLYAKLADKRVAEIEYVASKGDAEKVEKVSQLLDNYLTKVAVLAAARKERAGAGMTQDSTLSEKPKAVAPQPTPTPAPTPTQSPPKTAIERATNVPPQVAERAKLRAILVQYAVNHPERLQAALEKAPESVKPALQRAIKNSVAAYQKALENSAGNGNQMPQQPGKPVPEGTKKRQPE